MANSKTVVQKYFEKIKMSDQEIATSMGVSYVTVGRWRRGEKVPQKYHLDRLEKLALGQEINENNVSEPKDDRLYQLTIQIQLVQESIGEMKQMIRRQDERIALLESKKKPPPPPAQPVKMKEGSR